jgi:26S proteasome regulatory subunit N11
MHAARQIALRRPSERNFDTAEKVYVTGIAFLKMLKHAKAGVPLEVIGVLLGNWIDDFQVEVYDVYATPQVSTGSSVETTDEAFQVTMDALQKQLGYTDFNVGWYHSHPGFDVWFSDVDCQNQDNLERQNESVVGIVVDPILSVRGKVVIAAFRVVRDWITRTASAKKDDPREKTSFVGDTAQPRPATQANGLNVKFYQLPIVVNMSEPEKAMLGALYRPNWATGFAIPSFARNDADNLDRLRAMRGVAQRYRKEVLDEAGLSREQAEMRHVGKVNPKLFLQENADEIGGHHAALLARMHVTEASIKRA